METFNISVECTQNKQQHGTKIACTQVRKKVMVIKKKLLQLLVVLNQYSTLKKKRGKKGR